MDRCVDVFVLRQRADDASVAQSGIVDAFQVADADPVGDGAEIGVARYARRELLAAVWFDADLAE